MARRKPSPGELRLLRARLTWQFEPVVAEALLDGDIEVEYGARRRIRYVYLNGELILTLRPSDGLFSITRAAGEVIVKASRSPRYRVVVDAASRDELAGSVFARHVILMDPALRPGDEAVVVSGEDTVIGVGRVRVPPSMINGLSRGEVVRLK